MYVYTVFGVKVLINVSFSKKHTTKLNNAYCCELVSHNERLLMINEIVNGGEFICNFSFMCMN
jgi:hypothetical protein